MGKTILKAIQDRELKRIEEKDYRIQVRKEKNKEYARKTREKFKSDMASLKEENEVLKNKVIELLREREEMMMKIKYPYISYTFTEHVENPLYLAKPTIHPLLNRESGNLPVPPIPCLKSTVKEEEPLDNPYCLLKPEMPCYEEFKHHFTEIPLFTDHDSLQSSSSKMMCVSDYEMSITDEDNDDNDDNDYDNLFERYIQELSI